MQAQAPLVQVCPAPQVMVAHGSVTGLPPMLLSSLPAEPPTLETGAPAAPAATLIPPLAGAPPLPLAPTELPAPAFAGPPLEFTPLPPAPAVSLVPPELQASSPSSNRGEKTRGLCCINQE